MGERLGGCSRLSISIFLTVSAKWPANSGEILTSSVSAIDIRGITSARLSQGLTVGVVSE